MLTENEEKELLKMLEVDNIMKKYESQEPRYNMPNKLKIGGLIYKCTLEKNLGRDYSATGQSCNNDLWIKIDDSLPEQNKKSTLIHEIIEQINCIYELGLEHDKICTLETALYQVIADNKELF